ncbi:TIGR03618 family F420-dependent PPOX class oxidoreductase [Streptomyces johnsoniae]|uniref:TIGR03618 family F420-dependent PPOX class oxidoreductase n=1 Tax=Streptomyces johnsoniae TaxID=3075532 RepID=A0ABU2S544_9ACTN|nr:TIGR03618 family F420-dependent PPOX class oxidoreductase [Streptomyces sp. DSM 41886]MDT0443195.1 TIGR03618 family F420-dependent PPOX class oxidoreductase [Streptomyces sp. DSM 41886]
MNATPRTAATGTPSAGTPSAGKPAAGPPPRPLADAALSGLLAGQRFGVLASVSRDGHPHLTTVAYAWDPATRTLRISSTADRVKARQLRHDPRAALHVRGPDVWSFAVAEGEAEVSEATAAPGDAVGRELLGVLPAPEGQAAEAAFLAQLVAERRVVIRLRVTRLYGAALDVPGAVPPAAEDPAQGSTSARVNPS